MNIIISTESVFCSYAVYIRKSNHFAPNISPSREKCAVDYFL